MNTPKLSRKAIKEGLDQVPFADILGSQVNRELTTKQKTFALEIAKGATGAAAYRKAYSKTSKPKTQSDQAGRLKQHPGIAAEIQAYQLALEAQKHATPAALRSLVINSLVQVIINPDTKDSVKVSAAKVLGTVTEVAAFTERKEVHNITSSEDARAKVMTELQRMMNAQAIDVEAVDANSLLEELETHRSGTPQAGEVESLSDEHTIPLKQPLN